MSVYRIIGPTLVLLLEQTVSFSDKSFDFLCDPG